MYRYYEKFGDTDHISAWRSKELCDGSIKPPARSVNSFAVSFDYFGINTRVRFDRNCLEQDKITFKVRPSPSKKIVICFIESPLKMNDDFFYFILKALFVLKIFKFLS